MLQQTQNEMCRRCDGDDKTETLTRNHRDTEHDCLDPIILQLCIHIV